MYFEMNLKMDNPKDFLLSSYLAKILFFWFIKSVRMVEAISCFHRTLPVLSYGLGLRGLEFSLEADSVLFLWIWTQFI